MAFLRDRQSTGRRAFTLVEILVVIAIIGILLTGITIASFRALASARVNQTRSTIEKIDKMLSSRMAAFDRAMTGRNLAGGDTTDAELLTKYSNYRLGSESMRHKRLFAKFFGMSFGESQTSFGAPIDGFYADLTPAELAAAGFDVLAHQKKPETENPEMLYWFLMKGPTFGSDYQADFNSSEVADTDGDGLLEFIDAWGNPIRFYRWPTRLIRPAPAASLATPSQGSPYFAIGPADATGNLTPAAPASMLIASLPSYSATESSMDPLMRSDSPLGREAGDTYGDLLTSYAAEVGSMDYIAAARQFEVRYHTPNTWHAPLIVSAGPDGVLGLFEPTDRTNFGHLAQPKANAAGTGYSEDLQDNVTNLNGQASTGGGQ